MQLLLTSKKLQRGNLSMVYFKLENKLFLVNNPSNDPFCRHFCLRREQERASKLEVNIGAKQIFFFFSSAVKVKQQLFVVKLSFQHPSVYSFDDKLKSPHSESLFEMRPQAVLRTLFDPPRPLLFSLHTLSTNQQFERILLNNFSKQLN